MKKQLGMLLGLAMLFTVTGAGVAGAATDNKTITIGTPTQVDLPLNGNTVPISSTFQDQLHQKVEDATGKTFTYYDISINQGGTTVLVVDPPSGMW